MLLLLLLLVLWSRAELLRSRSKPVGAPGVLLHAPPLTIIAHLYPICIRSDPLCISPLLSQAPCIQRVRTRSISARSALGYRAGVYRAECAPNFWERAPKFKSALWTEKSALLSLRARACTPKFSAPRNTPLLCLDLKIYLYMVIIWGNLISESGIGRLSDFMYRLYRSQAWSALRAHSERQASGQCSPQPKERESLFILIIFGTVLFTKDNKGN